MKNANLIGTPGVTFAPGDVYSAQDGKGKPGQTRSVCKLGDLYPDADWRALRASAVKRRDYDLALKQDAQARRRRGGKR